VEETYELDAARVRFPVGEQVTGRGVSHIKAGLVRPRPKSRPHVTRAATMRGSKCHESTCTAPARPAPPSWPPWTHAPRVAVRILPHSKINVTMEIYTEAPSDATRDALRKLGDLTG
jgi:hypothetical protein